MLLTALARGYLTRRLLKSEKVQSLVNTIKVSEQDYGEVVLLPTPVVRILDYRVVLTVPVQYAPSPPTSQDAGSVLASLDTPSSQQDLALRERVLTQVSQHLLKWFYFSMNQSALQYDFIKWVLISHDYCLLSYTNKHLSEMHVSRCSEPQCNCNTFGHRILCIMTYHIHH